MTLLVDGFEEQDKPSLPATHSKASWPVSSDEDLVDLAPAINQALPEQYVDLLRDGVVEKNPGQPRLFGKFVSIAMSCRQRGWSEVQFRELVWSQEVRRYSGGEMRYGHWTLTIQMLSTVRGDMNRFSRQMVSAWSVAGDNLLREATLKTTDDFKADVIERAWAWEDRLDEGTDGLTDSQVQVIRYVTQSVVKRENSRVTCPHREVALFAQIPDSTALYTLKSLAKKGFLFQESRGRGGKRVEGRRAAIYSLGDPFTLPPKGIKAQRQPRKRRNPQPLCIGHPWDFVLCTTSSDMGGKP